MQASSTLLNAVPEPSPDRPTAPGDAIAEANHRIANSLALLVSMVRMQSRAVGRRIDPIPPAEARQLLNGVAARLHTIGQLYRMLSHLPEMGVAELEPHLRAIALALVSALGSDDHPVTVRHSGGGCIIAVRHMQPIALILCEIFINAMKYAHPPGKPLCMTVDCGLQDDGGIRLSIGDDGMGLPDGFDPAQAQGLGFRIIRSLAGEIGAQLDIQSGADGLTFHFLIAPMPEH